MSKMFAVSYYIVTPESAETGDVDETGYIDESESLRDAIGDLFKTRTNEVGGIECIECDYYPNADKGRSITVSNSMEYRTGAYESRSLHRPEGITNASWGRIVRLIKGR